MGVMLNVNWRFWDAAKASDAVGWPNPVVNPGTVLWPYQVIGMAAPEYAAAGFSVVVLPPSCECASGVYSGGYDKKDDYSLDNTAFGDGEMLRQCVAAIHAKGMQAYGDLVLHQYDGGVDGVYDTKVFPKTATCFSNVVGGVAADVVPDLTGDFPFGDVPSYTHAQPAGYMHDGAIAATQWLYATTGLDGFRVDEAKGTNAQVIYDILHAPGLTDAYAYFEYFDGSPGPVSNYVNGYEKRRGPVLDFAEKFNIGDICNNQGRVWMGQLSNIGYCTTDPTMAVTFVESADTDTSIGQQTIWNKMLAYAIVLTFPGYPQVYYRDWSDDPGCYGLKPWINNLVWIHNNLVGGDFIPRLDTDPQVFVHERTGWGAQRGCLCGFNNDPNNERTVTVQTNWAPGTRLHEFTGKYDTDIWTDDQGRATFTLAKNINGMGYLVFGIWSDTDAPPLPPRHTTQTFFCGLDPTIPVTPGVPCTVGNIWCGAGTALHIPPSVTVTPPAGPDLADLNNLPSDGWYSLVVENPTGPFEVTVTYTAGPVVEVAAG